MLEPRLNLAALCLAAMPAFFLYGCGDTDPGLVVAPTYDDSPLQFGISFSGSELKFDWDAVEGVSQYRLTQTAGDAEVIPGGQVLVDGPSPSMGQLRNFCWKVLTRLMAGRLLASRMVLAAH